MRNRKVRFTLAKGIPRRNYVVIGHTDFGKDERNWLDCDACRTLHRYDFTIFNEDACVILCVGCDCAQILTGEYAEPKIRDKAMKAKNPMIHFKQKNENGNYYSKKFKATLFKIAGVWRIYIDSRKLASNHDSAEDAAREVLVQVALKAERQKAFD